MPKSIVLIVAAAKKRFRVKYFGKNGEVLAVSEVLNTRKNAHKNIKAMGELVNNDMDVEDTTIHHKSFPEYKSFS